MDIVFVSWPKPMKEAREFLRLLGMPKQDKEESEWRKILEVKQQREPKFSTRDL